MWLFVLFFLFSLDCFSGKFVEIWAKILSSLKNVPTPTPVLRLAGHIQMLFFCFFLISGFCLFIG